MNYFWNHKLSSEQCRTCRAVRPCDIHVKVIHLEMEVCLYWCYLGALKSVRFRPCLIRPKARSGFQIRILKPWSCKGKHWIQVLFHGNKCDLVSIKMSEFIIWWKWIWPKFRIYPRLHSTVFYDQITGYELIAIFKFPLPLATLFPPSWIQLVCLLYTSLFLQPTGQVRVIGPTIH